MDNEVCRISFKDNIPELSAGMDRCIDLWLEESAAELKSDAISLSRRKTNQTARSYKHVVDHEKKEARVGSPEWNAVYEEYGTGEYAMNGNGRKGWWVYVIGGDKSMEGTSKRSHYTYEEARRAVAYLRSKGLDAHMTRGKTPNRPIFRAFSENEAKIVRRLEQLLNGMEDG